MKLVVRVRILGMEHIHFNLGFGCLRDSIGDRPIFFYLPPPVYYFRENGDLFLLPPDVSMM